jgi:nucleoside-diphosphate-sugar epimerase
MKFVVTGASGFLGRALMQDLAHRGIDAVGVSRHPFRGCIQVESYTYAPGGDVLVHLAEASDRAYAQANSPLYEQRSLATLDALQSKGFSRGVYASSAVLYGDREQSLRKVGDPVHALDAYTRLKLASEKAVLARGGIVARLVNLYGPGMAEGNVLSTILGQIWQDGPVRVLDTTPVRDFLWIDDAARALALMATGEASGVFNVGSGQGVSIRELANVVLDAAGQAGRPVESVRVGSRFSRLVVDIAQTKEVFGWYPAVTLVEGISTLVKMNTSKE